jgi:hypothetical protein
MMEEELHIQDNNITELIDILCAAHVECEFAPEEVRELIDLIDNYM